MSDIRIPVSVMIGEALDSHSWSAALPNGKIITVYQRKYPTLPTIKPGMRCTAHLSLCDFDHGKLVAVEEPAASEA